MAEPFVAFGRIRLHKNVPFQNSKIQPRLRLCGGLYRPLHLWASNLSNVSIFGAAGSRTAFRPFLSGISCARSCVPSCCLKVRALDTGGPDRRFSHRRSPPGFRDSPVHRDQMPLQRKTPVAPACVFAPPVPTMVSRQPRSQGPDAISKENFFHRDMVGRDICATIGAHYLHQEHR